jgi:uncharacterized DUF497 family protein
MGGRSIDTTGQPPRTLHFEWDPAKNASNTTKHQFSFEEATTLWDGRRRVEIDVLHHTEARQMNLGMIDGKLYAVITTIRGQRIRIISARRANSKEAPLYEQHHAGG